MHGTRHRVSLLRKCDFGINLCYAWCHWFVFHSKEIKRKKRALGTITRNCTPIKASAIIVGCLCLASFLLVSRYSDCRGHFKVLHLFLLYREASFFPLSFVAWKILFFGVIGFYSVTTYGCTLYGVFCSFYKLNLIL